MTKDTTMSNPPRNYDAILGGQNPCNAAVLGGLEELSNGWHLMISGNLPKH